MAGEEVAATGIKGFFQRLGGGIKMSPWVGLAAGAAVVAPFVLNSFREKKHFDDTVAIPKSLSDPLPPVLEFTAPAQELGPNTLMGQPMVEGPLARKVKMQRAGIAAGPDVTNPPMPNVDGKQVQDLSVSHVKNLQKEESAPNFGLSA